MSFISRLIQRFRPSRYVGRDLEGNLFYEHPGLTSDPRRTRRTVKYKHSEDVWHYIGGGKRLAIQWSSWLSHTRHHAPTLQELQADAARQRRVLANVTLIEARDREERSNMIQPPNALAPGHRHIATNTAASLETQPPSAEDPQMDATRLNQKRLPTSENPLPKMANRSDTYEPESWTPHAHTRGG